MEDMSQTSLPTKKHFEMMHGILLLITLVTMLFVLAIAYFTYGFVITFEQMRENHALQTNALGRIEGKMMEEKEEVVPLTTNNDVVIYENREEGFRVVTAPGCEGVFAVRPGQPVPDLRAEASWEIFVPKSAHWSTNPIQRYLKISAETVRSMQADPANRDNPAVGILNVENAIRITSIAPGTDYRLFSSLGGDGPNNEEIASANGNGSCPRIVQTIPTLIPEAG